MSNISGIGFGLSTAKKLSEAIGGSISISNNDNNGTNVTILIPVTFSDENLFLESIW